jgi:hypothetical protein
VVQYKAVVFKRCRECVEIRNRSMTKNNDNKKLISICIDPESIKEIQDFCNDTSMVGRTPLIEEVCNMLADEDI